jgi:HSP20 family protein
MAIVRYDPLPLARVWRVRPGFGTNIDRVVERFNRIVEDALAPRTAGAWEALRPGLAANLFDTGEAWVAELPVPGVKPEDLQVTVRENVLAVRAMRAWQSPEHAQVIWRGFVQGEWERSFTLPGEVNAEQVEATLEHGVLRLRLPKADHVLPRPIKVTAASPAPTGGAADSK